MERFTSSIQMVYVLVNDMPKRRETSCWVGNSMADDGKPKSELGSIDTLPLRESICFTIGGLKMRHIDEKEMTAVLNTIDAVVLELGFDGYYPSDFFSIGDCDLAEEIQSVLEKHRENVNGYRLYSLHIKEEGAVKVLSGFDVEAYIKEMGESEEEAYTSSDSLDPDQGNDN